MNWFNPKYAFVLFSLVLFQNVFAQTTVNTTKHALYLNSYAQGYAWSDSVAKGVIQTFQENQDVVLYIEYLDSKRFGKTLFRQQYGLFKSKYRHTNLGVIVTSDNNALDFILEFPDLFPNVPVVFCGIINPQDYDFSGKHFYGFKEGEHQEANLQLILDVKPEVETLYFLYDSTQSSLVNIKLIQELEPKFSSKVKFEYLSDLTLDKALSLVKNFDKKGAIATVDIYFRNETDPISPEEVVTEIAAISPIPIFEGRESTLGKGIIGGIFNSGVQHGADAASLALQLIKNPDYKPKQRIFEKQGKCSFDYAALSAHNINMRNIPEGSTVINQPTDLRKYLQLILALAAFVALQTFIIVVLIRNIYLRKSTQKKLLESYVLVQNKNTELEEASEKIQDMFSKLEETNAELVTAKNDAVMAMQKAERSDRLKTTFLENMSHEVRTPMNGIIGFSEMLIDSDIDNESRIFYTKTIQQSCNQLLRIIDDILEISTLSTQQTIINRTVFCLHTTLKELLDEFHEKSEEKKIPIYLKEGLQDEQFLISSDKNILYKIAHNLIENAVKFTNNGFVEIDYSTHGEEMTIKIKDTGIGISPDNVSLIFSHFSQEDDGISRLYGGLGLGLSIAKGYAELLGGKITVESEKGKGSIFSLTIPYLPDQSSV